MDGKSTPNLPEEEYSPQLSAEETSTLTASFEESGVKGVCDTIQKKLSEWRKTPLNVGIIGSSGAGKSSFINAIRGIDAEHELAAEVGATETTTEPQSFAHPDNASLCFWDLPGVGTPRFSKEKYLREISFHEYDFFVIMSKDRFTENDMWLAKEIQKCKKQFFFSRTHIDTSLEGEKWNHPKSFDEHVILKKIRENCRSYLEKGGIDSISVFLISNRFPSRWDFRNMVETLITDFPRLKKEAMLLSITTTVLLTETIFQQKKEVLQSRYRKVSIFSALVGAIPFPGIAAAFDAVLLIHEMNFIRLQFGVDDSSLKKMSSDIKSPFEKLQGLLAMGNLNTVTVLLNYLTSTRFGQNLASYSVLIPILGSILNGTASYVASLRFLNKFLDQTIVDAKQVLNFYKARL